MDSQTTSFIPKKPLAKDSSIHEAPVGILMLISTLVFFVSILGAAGVYFYKSLLTKQIEQYSTSLERAEKAFDSGLIVELERLDKRIESAKEILGKHVVVSPVFSLLEETTIPQVRFNRFSYTLSPDGQVYVEIGGQSRGYTYVVVQSDVLSKNKYISNHIFSNLNLDNLGNVIFALSAVLDPILISYDSFVNRGGDSSGVQ
ncbi:MAG: hypothetical protein AAB355_01110 [Patescibacteria group bacterium]